MFTHIKDGDKVTFFKYFREKLIIVPRKFSGTVSLCVYQDGEDYQDCEHYGYVINYKDSYGYDRRITLPDALEITKI